MEIMKPGSKGDNVKLLQLQLLKAGYKITADGIYGKNTQETVMQFQKDNGLTPDGIAGQATITALGIAKPDTETVKGIDISHLNGKINWPILVQNVQFVFCKASQGGTFKDPMFENNIAELAKAGVMRGAYHFLTFQNATAQEQAANFLSCSINYSDAGVLPPVLDVEWQVSGNKEKTDALNNYIKNNRAQCVQLVKDWLENVEAKTGRTPIIYTNYFFWQDYLGNPAGFEKYPLWIAAYQKTTPQTPPGWANYTFWQTSGSGNVNGIAGQVDTDVFNGNLNDLKKLALMQTQ